MKRLWISGWAVPPAWFAAQAKAVWPHDEHTAVAPHEAGAALATARFDALGGYSLGTLWLLRHSHLVPVGTSALLLAPIFAFPAENNLGGRIPRAQLRAQRRQLRRDAPAALLAFAQLSGLAELNIPAPPDELDPAHLAALDTGLGWLENWSAPVPPPEHWSGFVGEADSLLDAARLQSLWPAVHCVPAAGHAPGPLLHAAATRFPTFVLN